MAQSFDAGKEAVRGDPLFIAEPLQNGPSFSVSENGVLIFRHSRSGRAHLAWFDRELPRCMELIPRRRRASFLAGVYTEVEEDDGVLMP